MATHPTLRSHAEYGRACGVSGPKRSPGVYNEGSQARQREYEMSTIKTITLPDGRQAQAEEVDFKLEHEDWSQYALPDGTVVKLKTTVLKILQVLDDSNKPARTPEGDPLLVVNHRTDVITRG
jgi:hypothetical protein